MVITLELWPARGRNRTGARTVLASELTDGQWNLIKDLFVERRTGGRPWGGRRVPAWKVSCGCSGRALDGGIYQRTSHRTPPAADDWASAWRPEFSKRPGEGCGTSWMPEAGSTGGWPWPMPHLRRQKRGGADVSPTERGKGSKLMLLIDGKGLPLAVNVDSASPAEVTLIEPLLDRHVLGEHSIRLIYDRAADSDPLRERLAADGIELICSHRKGRKRPAVQDGRSLKRYRSRWKMERTIAWLQNYRRLVVRYEHDSGRFLAFAQLACLHKVLKGLNPFDTSSSHSHQDLKTTEPREQCKAPRDNELP